MAKIKTKKTSKKILQTKSKKAAAKTQSVSILKSKPSKNNNVVSRQNIDGTATIMRLDQDERFYTLDGIAAELWFLVDGKSDLSAILTKLRKKHKNAPEARLQKDSVRMLTNLSKEELISL